MSQTNTPKSSTSAASKKASTAKTTSSKTAAPAKEEAKTTTAKTATAEKVAVKESTVQSVTVAEISATSKPEAETKSVQTADTKSDKLDLSFNYETVAKTAYFLWEKEGYQHGYDRAHWLQAEELVKKQLSTSK